MKSLKVGSCHISKCSLLLRLLFLLYCSLTSKCIVCPFFSKSRSCWVFASSTRYALLKQEPKSSCFFFLHILSQWSKTLFSSGITKLFFLDVMHKKHISSGGIMRWWDDFKQTPCSTSLPAYGCGPAVKTIAGLILGGNEPWNSVKVSTDDHPTSISPRCGLHIQCDMNENEALMDHNWFEWIRSINSDLTLQ